jgi:HAD superfamily hydrolase (TIGR01457 family)
VRLVDGYDCFLLDIDGVLMRGDEAIPHAEEAIERLRSESKPPVFMTNNSARTAGEVAAMLKGVGIAARSREVVTSALATADLLRRDGVGRAFVVGERGLREAVGDAGIEIIDGDPDDVDAVVVGWDRMADYARLRRASLLVERGARLVATNADAAFPADDGSWPGAGALLSVITVTTGMKAVVVGKPNPALFLAARERAGGSRPLVIGDRLDTDIAGAAAVGWDSLLVLTGIASRSDVERADTRPTYVAPDLSALFGSPPTDR